ncbi:hypothetical protein CASFOL_009676 [Castilleja foliolosa]|uniref:F-box domain-containing protein n=1 Tax=Castilleja foliolosa TaxID=1961234 RepID=A0ABD3DQD2_9LAMI
MKQKTWPCRSDGLHFTSLPFIKKTNDAPPTFTKPSKIHLSFFNSSRKTTPPPPSTSSTSDFSALPYDVILKIAAPFTLPNLKTASLVCRAWRDALKPLREAMVFLKWGKRFKHGRGGLKANKTKALDCFLKGAARGSTLAMVDAGLIYWEMGKKEEGIVWYRKAAELGDPAGQCNLAISYLQAKPPNTNEGIKWLYLASYAGHVRAQYQLALCLHQGRGVGQSLHEAARWYLIAAEGGYVRAMYNTSLCYLTGEGLMQSHSLARKWMKKAADHGHSKAQFEHGLGLFSEGDMMKAVVYLELATRAGERAAAHVKNVVLQQLSATSRDQAILLANTWRALPASR